MLQYKFSRQLNLRTLSLQAITWCFLALVIVINLFFAVSTADKLLDFGSFIASAKNASIGKNPYSPASPLVFSFFYPRLGVGGQMPNLNPPITVVIFKFVANISPIKLVTTWRLASLIIYLAALLVLLIIYKNKNTPTKMLWALSLAGLWHTIELGQLYIPLLLFYVLGLFAFSRGRNIVTGFFLGLVVALKPNFAIWLLLLVLVGFWEIGAFAATTTIIVSVIPILFYGSNIYSQWLKAIAPNNSQFYALPGNSSITGLISRFGDYQLGTIISMIALVIVLYIVVTSRNKLVAKSNKFELINALGIITSILISPIAWVGYTILLLPTFLSLSKWSFPFRLGAGMLAIPFLFPLLLFDNSFFNFVFWGWWYGWAILILFIYLLVRLRLGNDF
jgi:alpha-1,2-mannosyltransferase